MHDILFSEGDFMEKVKRVEIFKTISEISDYIELVYEKVYNKKVEGNERSILLSRVIGAFNPEQDYVDEMLSSVLRLRDYIKTQIISGSIDANFINDWYEKSLEIEELIYSGREAVYNIEKKEVLELAQKYYDSLERKDLLKLEKDYSQRIQKKLGQLFGAKKGVIMGNFNKGMYGANQTETSKYLKENNVEFRCERFVDIMSDHLLCYRVAGLHEVKEQMLAIYYGDYADLTDEEKEEVSKTGYYSEKSKEYRYMETASFVIGKIVKELYANKYGVTPLDELENSNVYGEQLSIDSIIRK